MTKRDVQRLARSTVRNAIPFLKTSEVFERDGEHYRAVFVGSLINPSGKFYTPFAHSNVRSCPRCKGAVPAMDSCTFCGGLGSREAYLDELFWEAIDAALERHDAWTESGEDDPCDTFFVTSAEEEL